MFALYLPLIATYVQSLYQIVGSDYYGSTLDSSMSISHNSSNNLILPFNKTRIPGSSNSKEVREFIFRHFDKLNQKWILETTQFQENGYEFTNIIYTLGDEDNYLMLAAHYDSKIDPTGFIGAIDSAASCAMLLYVAKFVDTVLTDCETTDCPLNGFTGLKIVFFDGEEAIHEWGPTDSKYGSRYLAEKMESNGSVYNIGLLILLDLLGSQNQNFVPNYYREHTEHYYETLWKLEARYNSFYSTETHFFDPSSYSQTLWDDDHVPFLARDVPTLHLIPSTLPTQWHKLEDDFAHLDQDIVNKWTILICEFVIEYYQ
ncbi:uncharacterized protein Ecym_2736 [Eremothecium cymbalariae DBVPG|uniref:Peptide hydrolase n=1 Tax=Eremothecium cymbalariae (strain CBS 270.75 / DBVPG 7215 / KCTC 17166 / NRRL Y-17582) TaxID=931890 RepID=G8JPG9_ERECY|nr:Hypothetical protein Ecym_2736 [Eremothecium cymbalariae DBVPG\